MKIKMKIFFTLLCLLLINSLVLAEETGTRIETKPDLYYLTGKIIRVKTLEIEDGRLVNFIGRVKVINDKYQRLTIEPCKETWIERMAENKIWWIVMRVDKDIYPFSDRVQQIYIMEKGKEDALFYDNPQKKQGLSSKKAQERELSIYGRILTGWRKTKDGKWMKNSWGMIPLSKAYLDTNDEAADHTSSYKFREFDFEDQKYGAVIKGFGNSKTHYAWIFSLEELDKLKNINDGQPNIITFNLITMDIIERETDYIDLSEWFYDHPENFKKNMKTKRTLYIVILPDRKENEVKFLIFAVMEKLIKKPKTILEAPDNKPVKAEAGPDVKKKTGQDYSYVKAYIVEGFSKPGYFPLNIITTEKTFDFSYYQTSFTDFNYFMKIDYEEYAPIPVFGTKAADTDFEPLINKIIRVKTLDQEYDTFVHFIGKVKDVNKIGNVPRIILEPIDEEWAKRLARDKMGWLTSMAEKNIYPANERVHQIYIMEQGRKELLYFDNPAKAPKKFNETKALEREISSNARHFRGLSKNKDGSWNLDTRGFLLSPDKTSTSIDSTLAYRLQQFEYNGKKYAGISKILMEKNIGYYWVFPVEELEQLKRLNDGKPNIVKINLTATETMPGENVDLSAWFSEHPENFEKNTKPSRTLYIHIRPSKEDDTVDFLIFSTREEQEKISKVMAEASVQHPQAEAGPMPKRKPVIKYTTVKRYAVEGFSNPGAFPLNIVTTEKVFDFAYYQTSYSDFNYFLTIDEEPR